MNTPSSSTRDRFYLLYVLLLTLILPLVSILVEVYTFRSTLAVWKLAGRWFLFWAIGIRLFTAGISQVVRPGFTLHSIFHITSTESYVVVRELGFGNICLGLAGILSIVLGSWRIPVAFIAGLFLGLDAVQHAIKGPASRNELLALITDALVCLVMAVFVFLSYVSV